jgi:integrase/recombinase XerD
MILSQAVEQYILHKRSLGMGFRSEAVRLGAFVQAIGDRDMHLIESAPVLRFLEGTGPVTTFWFSKYHTLKAFYRYALARDYCASCPLPLSVPQKPDPFQPYIYTNQDIERLIDAADSRHRYRWLLEPHTVRTLLLLLYGTGLRISEALRLTLEDFDTGAGVLTIRETKFFKSRSVPVGSDLSGVLCNYIKRQWPQRSRFEATPLLGTHKGAPITRQQRSSSSSGFVNKPAYHAPTVPAFSRDCTTSAIPSRSFVSSPGTARERTSSGSCLTCRSISDMACCATPNATST